jgi:hypothetical protein
MAIFRDSKLSEAERVKVKVTRAEGLTYDSVDYKHGDEVEVRKPEAERYAEIGWVEEAPKKAAKKASSK